MNKDIEKWLEAIAENYDMTEQYKHALNDLLKTRKLKYDRISKNFRLLINQMETKFSKETFYNIIGKTYDLNDPILYTIRKTDEKSKSHINELQNFEKWLMSDIFRHVTNPDIENYPNKKYIGKIKFTKIMNSRFDNEPDRKWTPDGKYSVDDIIINVYIDDEMKIERRYEEEYGWKDEWYAEMIYDFENFSDEEKCEKRPMYDEFIAFTKKWTNLKEKIRVPGWYYFDPDEPTPRRYEKQYGWNDEWYDDIFDSLVLRKMEFNSSTFKGYKDFVDFEKRWNEAKVKKEVPVWYNFNPRNPKVGQKGRNGLKNWDSSMFQILKDQKWYEATKEDICDRKALEEASELVVDCNQLLGVGGEGLVIKRSISQKIKPENGIKYEALKVIPITAENFESVCQDIQMAANNAKQLNHNSLMQYLDVQLDFIKVFGEKVFAMVIGNNNYYNSVKSIVEQFLLDFIFNCILSSERKSNIPYVVYGEGSEELQSMSNKTPCLISRNSLD